MEFKSVVHILERQLDGTIQALESSVVINEGFLDY
jgi:hypothetical protein